MFIFDFENVIIAGILDDVADSPDRHIEGELFKWASQGVALYPAPISAIVAGAVLRINLRGAIELCSAGKCTEQFFSQGLLRRRARRSFLARNRDHSQFDLLLGGRFLV